MALRRADAARARTISVRVRVDVPSLIFRKGLDLKACRRRHAGRELSQRRSSSASRPTTSSTARGRLTVHLAREFGFCYGVDRAVDYAYQTRKRFPDRRVFLTGEIIHNPHVNEKLRAMGIRLPERRPGASSTRLGRDDVVILPAFGVTVAMLAAARSPRLHARRHHLRVGAERLEERPPLRRRRLHVDHPRQGLARGDAGHRVAGGRVRRPLPGRVRRRTRPRSSATTSGGGGDRDAFLERFADAARPASIPTATSQRIGLANQTTMLMSESLEIGEMLRAAMIDRYGDGQPRRALSGVRHDLQRDAGSPGRRRRAAARQAGRPDDRDRRLQQQQHLQPGPHLRRSRGRRSTSPTRTAWCRREEIRHRPVGQQGRGARRRAGCRRRARHRRADVRRVDAGQPGRRDAIARG